VLHLLRHRAATAAGASFLTVGGETWSFADAAERASCRAATLRDTGLREGDRVVALLGNGPLLVELFLACAWSGAILVPVNVASRGPQLRHVLADAEPTVVVADAALAAQALGEGMLPASVQALWIDGSADGPAEAAPVPGLGVTCDAASVGPGDAVAILYTSGTTGPPKGVVCPQAQFWWWGRNTGEALSICAGDVLFTCLPLFHTNALNTLVQSLFHGVPVVVGERFSASGFWSAVAAADATVTYILGTMASILAARDPAPLDRAHRLRVALSPATDPALWPVFEERFGVRLVEGHGMTETNFVLGPREGVQRPGWMGRAMPGFDARAVDEHDSEVPPGTPGELVVRAEQPFAFARGYWRLPDATVDSWRNLWFHTGDRVVQDEDGWFRFLDRIKDAIRRRGENVSAWEVEQALSAHPRVVAAAAVPVPSALGEDDVMAYVICREGAVDPVELIRWSEERLPYFAVPRYLEFVTELPVTENGKVRKFVLREQGVTETTWDREAAGVALRR
jgi:crotonobetaine/carnitine-CoA ligase